MSRIRAIDIGGSGVKTAIFDSLNGKLKLASDITYFNRIDFDYFEIWVKNNIAISEDIIAISTCGFVDELGRVTRNIATWKNRDLPTNFKKLFPSVKKIIVINDGEAHLYSSQIHLNNNLSIMSLAIGTSVAFGFQNNKQGLIRPSSKKNFDIGELPLVTSASNNKAWFAIGSYGLEELEKNHEKNKAVKQFGHRLGNFSAILSSIFQPDVIFLTGGIIENNWKGMKESFQRDFELAQPSWHRDVEILLSPTPKNSALYGVAHAAINIF